MGIKEKQQLISVLEGHMLSVEDFCRTVDVPDEIRVHEIRKAFKRINALLRFLPKSLKPIVKEFRIPMKTLARSLTLARETTVNYQFFGQMSEEKNWQEMKDAKDLKQQLIDKNRQSLEALRKGESVYEQIIVLMQEGRNHFLEKLKNTEFETDTDTVLQTSFQKARELFLNSGDEYHPEAYHELRKKMKILWYQVEFLYPGEVEVPGTLSEILHNITDQLGDDHDWYIFLQEIDEDKYMVTDELKALLDKTIEQYQKANLALLNQNLQRFFEANQLAI